METAETIECKQLESYREFSLSEQNISGDKCIHEGHTFDFGVMEVTAEGRWLKDDNDRNKTGIGIEDV